MSAPGADDALLRASRSALLDVLELLVDQRDALILVGAHAIYIRAGAAPVALAGTTKDSDLAVNPELLAADPLLEQAMASGNWRLRGQPGVWVDERDVSVDLLVPEGLADSTGSRGARIPPHSKTATRKVRGLEAAVVDNDLIEVGSLEPADDRVVAVLVASVAALVVAKLHKLGEREAQPSRLLDKDAHDLYRLFVASDTEDLAASIRVLLADERSREVTEQAIEYLDRLFGTTEALGAKMAASAEGGLAGDDADSVAFAVSALAEDLLAAVRAS